MRAHTLPRTTATTYQRRRWLSPLASAWRSRRATAEACHRTAMSSGLPICETRGRAALAVSEFGCWTVSDLAGECLRVVFMSASSRLVARRVESRLGYPRGVVPDGPLPIISGPYCRRCGSPLITTAYGWRCPRCGFRPPNRASFGRRRRGKGARSVCPCVHGRSPRSTLPWLTAALSASGVVATKRLRQGPILPSGPDCRQSSLACRRIKLGLEQER